MDVDQISKELEKCLKPYIGTHVVNVNTMDMVKRAVTDYLAIHTPEHDWDVKVRQGVATVAGEEDPSQLYVTCTPPPEVIARIGI